MVFQTNSKRFICVLFAITFAACLPNLLAISVALPDHLGQGSSWTSVGQNPESAFSGDRNDDRSPFGRGESFNTFIHNLDIFGIKGGMAATVTLKGVSGNGVAGTLKLNQTSMLANMKVQGSITGLSANQVININGRTTEDVSSDCANQGAFRNPTNSSAAGGYLVTSATADATGTVTVDTSVAAADVSLYAPKGIIKRSIRVSAGAKSSEGSILACGTVDSLTP